MGVVLYHKTITCQVSFVLVNVYVNYMDYFAGLRSNATGIVKSKLPGTMADV